MGDRANVRVIDCKSSVYLYSHWSGSQLPVIVQAAMRRGKDRWTDGSYLARIIFNEMTKGHETDTKGFGISAQVGDGEDRVIAVNLDTGRVQTNGGHPYTFGEFTDLRHHPEWTDE